MATDERIAHLLRRAGFGGTEAEDRHYEDLGLAGALDELLHPERVPDDVDANIGRPGFVGTTSRGPFTPNSRISDASQRWLFRMVHGQRPLQEKMALYWHHHFATAYSKVAGGLGAEMGARVMAAVPAEDPAGIKGQIELFRERALGNFGQLLLAVARDVAMLEWLDGRTNVKGAPQENFARELMELFTMGVGTFSEDDVRAGARAFTGWNLRRVGDRTSPSSRFEYVFNPGQHDTESKSFSFAIYPDGSRTIPARAGSSGEQDGLDLLAAVAAHPETARRLARRLYAYFVSELTEAPTGFVDAIAAEYRRSGQDMRAVVGAVLASPEFDDPANRFARYAWPVEFVVRAIKAVGWVGFSLGSTASPLINMGQQLYEPPDVNGWALGPEWFTTGSTLARMNFAASLATNQRFNLRDAAVPSSRTPSELLDYMISRLSPRPFDRGPLDDLSAYLTADAAWSGSREQVLVKAPGLAHLVMASGEYQLV